MPGPYTKYRQETPKTTISSPSIGWEIDLGVGLRITFHAESEYATPIPRIPSKPTHSGRYILST